MLANSTIQRLQVCGASLSGRRPSAFTVRDRRARLAALTVRDRRDHRHLVALAHGALGHLVLDRDGLVVRRDARAHLPVGRRRARRLVALAAAARDATLGLAVGVLAACSLQELGPLGGEPPGG